MHYGHNGKILLLKPKIHFMKSYKLSITIIIILIGTVMLTPGTSDRCILQRSDQCLMTRISIF